MRNSGYIIYYSYDCGGGYESSSSVIVFGWDEVIKTRDRLYSEYCHINEICQLIHVPESEWKYARS